MRRIVNVRESVRGGDRERGAVGVIVAGLALVLIGAGALAVDVGQIYSERAELQNAADAGALMAANACSAAMGCDPSVVLSAAQDLADMNSKDGRSEVLEVITTVPAQVTVRTSTWNGESDAGFLTKLFSQALDAPAVKVGATATATWYYPTTGVAVLPLAFATCEFKEDGEPQVVLTQGSGKDDKGKKAPDCNSLNPSGQIIPGGFAWLNPDDVTESCKVTAEVGQWSKTSPGGAVPNDCKYLFDALLSGDVIALPVYEYTCAGEPDNPDLWGNSCKGDNVYYKIQKWAGFKIEAWDFPGAKYDPNKKITDGKGIYGTFVGYSADPNTFTGGSTTPNGNVVVAKLIK